MESIVDTNNHRAVLSMLVDSIVEANLQTGGNWAVQCQRNDIRLTVGHYYIFVIDRNGIWLALDRDLIDTTNCLTELENAGWVHDERYGSYKDKYQNIFSVNGYYVSQSGYLMGWSSVSISQLHFAFINSIITVGQSMDSRTPNTHSPGVVQYLRNTLGRTVPDPTYE